MVFKIQKIDKLASTNAYIKQIVTKNDYNEGLIILTNNQTKGKGQQGNFWESEKDKNLTFSLFLKPTIFAGDMFIISKMISVAIIRALNEINIPTTIKWPNDIYYNNNKIGGILIENQLIGSKVKHSIIGIGLNINQTTFVSNAPNPISLKNISGVDYDIDEILKLILQEIVSLYNNSDFTFDIEEKYEEHLYRKTGFHKYKTPESTFNAKIIDVENDGRLLLEKEDGNQIGFYFKEVEFIIN